MKDFSYITNSAPAFIENLYREFLKDPGNVDPEMRKFFEAFDFAMGNATVNGNGNTPAQATAAPALPAFDIDWMR